MSTAQAIINTAIALGGDLSDDAAKLPAPKPGHSTWDLWQYHLVEAVRTNWNDLPKVARAVAYLQANSMRAWTERK